MLIINYAKHIHSLTRSDIFINNIELEQKIFAKKLCGRVIYMYLNDFVNVKLVHSGG